MRRDLPDAVPEPTPYVNLERLVFLVDGVFAITMTLLVLELRPPEMDASHLSEGLLEMLPRLVIYLVAFYTIVNHWVIHQRTFRMITHINNHMLWLTILGLLFITLMPASTALVGSYPHQALAVACFSANSFLQALASWAFWAYASKEHEKFANQADPRMVAITAQVWFMISAGWLVSILLSFVSVYLAFVSWVLLPNLVALWGARRRRILANL